MGGNVGLDNIRDNVQLSSLFIRVCQLGAEPALGCVQRLLNFAETYLVHRHMPSTRCSHYAGPSRYTLGKCMEFESAVSQPNSQT